MITWASTLARNQASAATERIGMPHIRRDARLNPRNFLPTRRASFFQGT